MIHWFKSKLYWIKNWIWIAMILYLYFPFGLFYQLLFNFNYSIGTSIRNSTKRQIYNWDTMDIRIPLLWMFIPFICYEQTQLNKNNNILCLVSCLREKKNLFNQRPHRLSGWRRFLVVLVAKKIFQRRSPRLLVAQLLVPEKKITGRP